MVEKGCLCSGVVYLLLPFDLIPPLVPVFGWLDDILLWVAILYFLGPELDKYAPETASGTDGRRKKYRYKDGDVQEVDFTISDIENTKEEESDERQG